MERNEIESKYKWDLTELYATESDFEKEIDEVKKLLPSVKKHSSTMTKSADKLADTCEDIMKVRRIFSRLAEYASRLQDIDTRDNKSQARLGKVIELSNAYSEAISYFQPTLMTIDSEVLDKWLSENERLAKYVYEIKDIVRYRPHIRSKEEEALLSKVSAATNSHDNIYSMLVDSDMKFGKIRGEDGKLVELTNSNFVPLAMSSDRRVRKAAFDKLYSTYAGYRNTFAALMQGMVKERTTFAKIANFKSSIEESTFSDDVTPEICNNLIATVSKNLKPLYRYYELKRRLLGVQRFHLYDVYPPIIDCEMNSYNFEDAKKTVLKALAPLGKDYTSKLAEGYENGWIDVMPNTGKRGGAYSAGCYDSKPYILLNWNGTFDDMSTLAHESGHSMHSVYTRENNSFENADYKIFVAEVPSTTNELLLARYLLKNTEDDNEKLFILNQLLDLFKGTLYRQTMFAEFERDIYAYVEKGETLTADYLCGHYRKLVRKYFGKDVVIDKLIENEWMRIPHFYYYFYVYKYSTCISAAAYVAKHIEDEGAKYVKKYKEFMSCGATKSPLDSLKVAGVDLTSPKVVENAVAMFEETLDMFEQILNKKEGK